MKLTPAETWNSTHNWDRFQHIDILCTEAVDERRNKFIRQIQADALRRGAYRCQTVADIHSNPTLASVAQNLADELNKEANQLHPLRESPVVSKPYSSTSDGKTSPLGD